MTIYEIHVNGEVVATFEADFKQASDTIELDGRATPFQVADAKHDVNVAAELLNGWCHSEGGSIWKDGDKVKVREYPEITEVRVYWDVQDPFNESWAVKWFDGTEIRGSEGVDAESLSDAIEQVISMLGLTCTADHFAISREEGGYAIWTRVSHRG
jgi:hypothetical protein